MKLSRRQFLGSSASAVLVAGTMAKGKVFGANSRIQAACVGIHGRGGSHIRDLVNLEDSEVVALCDVDRNVLKGRAKAVEDATGVAPKTYVDMRELLEDASIDVVTFATPNHWHSLGTIWACEAGKDVYVEKPLSHNIWEGRQLVKAAAKYNRIVQHGTQRRSSGRWMRDMKLLHDGIIGEVYMARALCYKHRGSIGMKPTERAPDWLDWNLWQGPAQERKFSANYVHYNWHWFWDYGNGDIGNQGVHQMDVAVWGMNRGLPRKVYSTGGRYTYDDQGETPNTQVATFTYDDGSMLVFEVRGRWTNDEMGVRVGNLFYGSEGYYVEGKGFFNQKNEPIEVDVPDEPSDSHFANFLKAVRSRNEQNVHGTALDGHISSAHCHLANISYRTGGELEFSPKEERFKDSRKANRLLARNYRKQFSVPRLT